MFICNVAFTCLDGNEDGQLQNWDIESYSSISKANERFKYYAEHSKIKGVRFVVIQWENDKAVIHEYHQVIKPPEKKVIYNAVDGVEYKVAKPKNTFGKSAFNPFPAAAYQMPPVGQPFMEGEETDWNMLYNAVMEE